MKISRIILIFVILLLLNISIYAQAPYSKRDSLARKTVQITDSFDNSASVNNDNSVASAYVDIVEIARERRSLLKELVKEDPQAVLDNHISSEIRNLLPYEAQQYIETEVNVVGKLEVLHIDYKDGTSEFNNNLETSSGERIGLHFAEESPQDVPEKNLMTGATVSVNGIQVDNEVAAAGADTSVEVLAAPANANTFGVQKTAVFIVAFQNKPTVTSISPSEANSVVFTSSTSANKFFDEASYNQMSLNGTVLGPYVIPMSSTNSCDYYGIASMADQAATAAGVNLAPYTRRVYAFPSSTCPWWGLGTVGGDPSKAWIQSSFVNGVVSHEMGHNLGLYHSHALECGSSTIGGTCTSVEYGDTFDVMGSATPPKHFNSAQKEMLGWLNYQSSPPITTVTADGTYSIAAYETPGNTAHAIKIRNTNGKYYYGEWRQPIGFDQSVVATNANVKNGLLVHLSEGYNGIYLLDMTPATSSWWDPALEVGKSFQDPSSGITITTSSVSPTALTVDVKMGGPSCIRKAPTYSLISQSASSGYSGSPIVYSYSITNNDVNCGNSQFSFESSIPSNWRWYNSLGSTFTLTAGQSRSGNIIFNSNPNALAGLYPYSLKLIPGGAQFSVTNNFTYNSLGPSTAFFENFNNGNTVSYGVGSWDYVSGYYLLSNALTGSGVQNVVTLWGFNGSDTTISADFMPTNQFTKPQFGVLLRAKDPNNGYWLYRQTGTGLVGIDKLVNNLRTNLASKSFANPIATSFFHLEGRAIGNNLSLWINGKMELSVLDSSYAFGYPGIYSYTYKSSGVPSSYSQADNFNATRRIVQVNCTKKSPAVSISPLEQSAQAGQNLSYSITVTNRDANCAPATITVTPILPNGFLQNPVNLVETLSSGQSITKQVTISSPQNAAIGANGFTEIASHSDPSVINGQSAALFTVLAKPNAAPNVRAGNDVIVPPNVAAQLSATATDDGLPNPPGELATLWAQISGPGTATFSNPVDTLNPTVTFSSVGTYVLRLTATDGQLSAFDEITVTVQEKQEEFFDDFNRPDSTVIGNGWQETGGDFVITNNSLRINSMNTSTLILPEFRAHDIEANAKFTSANNNRGLFTGIILRYKDDNNFYSFYRQIGGTSRIGIAKMENGKSTILSTRKISRPTANIPFSLDAEARGDKLSIKADNIFLEVSDSTFIKGSAGFYIDPSNLYQHELDDVSLIDLKKPNEAPAVKAGEDRKTLLGKSIQLYGYIKDDELPSPPEQVTFQWSQLNGPTVTFDTSSLNPTIVFSSLGSYNLRLAASDSELTASDDMNIEVVNSFNDYEDGFNRPDAEEVGNNWIEQGDLKVVDGRVETANLGMNALILDGFSSPSIFAGADFGLAHTNGAPEFGFILRYRDNNNYYKLYRLTGGSPKLIISKVVDGVETILATKKYRNPARYKPFRLEASAIGNELIVKYSNTVFASVVDDTFTDGKAGIFASQTFVQYKHTIDNAHISSSVPAISIEENTITGNLIKKVKYQVTDLLEIIIGT